jgi:hypothetical protein
VLVANNKPITIGMWVAQNLFEVTFTNASVTICATSTLATNNVMWWNNFIRGARNQFFYNESGNSLRSFCFALNSIFDVCGESTDNSAGTANGANVNDWSVRWRVGHSGCVNKMDDDFPTHGNPEFVGRRSFRPPNGDSSLAGFDKVTDDQGYANGGGTSGGGNYRLLSNSPLHSNNYKHRWVLPFDLEMNGRGQWDPPGPYSAGTTRKGCMFFAA